MEAKVLMINYFCRLKALYGSLIYFALINLLKMRILFTSRVKQQEEM